MPEDAFVEDTDDEDEEPALDWLATACRFRGGSLFCVNPQCPNPNHRNRNANPPD